jgi:tripartite-type tricarboxylate transporter receptor subunit TctC
MRNDMTTFTRRILLAGATALAAALAVGPAARAQSSTMTILVPYPPGGSTDALARLLQPALQERLKRNVVVENRVGGAAGAVGSAHVAKSPPDGSIFLITFDAHAVMPAIIEKPPLDIETDLAPVFLFGTAPYVIAANADKPYKTIGDVIEACRKEPGAVKYASVGVGTLGHLAMTVIGKRSGVEITHVPYRGGGPAMNDALGGHVDLIAGSAALITPQLEGGKLRPLLQTGRERLAALKDTPTAIEAGFENFEALAWWGLFAPKGTPADVIAPVESAIRAILSDPVVMKRLQESQQMTLTLGGPAEMGAFLSRQVKLWGQVVRENNIRQ